MGRATVYRTIKLFLETGVICKLPLLEGAHLYLLCGVGHHHHSVCVECGEVEELRAAAVERLISAVSADIRGEIVEHRLELYVNCGACPGHRRFDSLELKGPLYDPSFRGRERHPVPR